jgi:DNA-directed RNA polymerase specialized sigma24 family protein
MAVADGAQPAVLRRRRHPVSDAAVARDAPADALLVRDYERLKPEILRTLRGKLARRGVRFDEADLEAFYNQAWHGLYARLAAGEAIANVSGLLVTIAERRAIDELRSLHPERRADAGELDVHRVEPDLAARLDDHLQLKHFVEGLRDRLNAREREAAVLCYVHDYTRAEAARLLGVSPRRMEKLMDAVSKKVGAFVREIRGGEWCETRHSLIKAYALGLLDPGGARYRLAAEHLEHCPACRHRVLRLRGLAALTPPMPLALVAGGAGAAHPRLGEGAGDASGVRAAGQGLGEGAGDASGVRAAGQGLGEGAGDASGGRAVRPRLGRRARNAAVAAGAAGVLAVAAWAAVRVAGDPPPSDRAGAAAAAPSGHASAAGPAGAAGGSAGSSRALAASSGPAAPSPAAASTGTPGAASSAPCSSAASAGLPGAASAAPCPRDPSPATPGASSAAPCSRTPGASSASPCSRDASGGSPGGASSAPCSPDSSAGSASAAPCSRDASAGSSRGASARGGPSAERRASRGAQRRADPRTRPAKRRSRSSSTPAAPAVTATPAPTVAPLPVAPAPRPPRDRDGAGEFELR